MMSNTIRIGLIVNDLLLRVGLRTLLTQSGLSIDLIFVSPQWAQAPHSAFIDVLIIDDITPIHQAQLIISKFQNLWDRPGIVVISNLHNDQYFIQLMHQGVQVCLHRQDITLDLLRSGVIDALNNEALLSPTIDHLTKSWNPPQRLTHNDVRLLRLMDEGHSITAACRMLKVSRRWSHRSLKRMRRVLNVPNNALLIATAREQGLV